MLLFVLLTELLALYFLSGWVTTSVYTLLLLVFRIRSVAISILLLMQFPGTVVHELAHLFTAEILRVPTGKLTLVPESIRDAQIRSGSVMIGESDPFRRYAIGLAPLFTGMIVLSALSYFLPSLWESVRSSGIPLFQNIDTYWLALIGYCIFAISNAMFPSSQDLKGFTPFAIALAGLGIAGYLIGMRFMLHGHALELATQILTTLTQTVQIVLLLNIVLLIASWGLTQVLLRVFGLRVTQTY
jgi:hypothetical protein